MKKNRKDIKPIRSAREWEDLVERYFDALTTDAEEQELRSFLLSSEAVGEVFDEARTVMGFLNIGRAIHRNKLKQRPTGYWKVAAILCGIVVGATLWSTWDKTQNVCEAYIYGTKYTEVALVMSQMQHSLDKVNYGKEENIVETQLRDLFQLIEEE